MDGNNYMLFVAALIPMIAGFIWYNPKFLGNVWMREAKVTNEDVQGGNMALIFGLSYLFSVMLAFFLNFFVHHDMGVYGAVFDPELGVSPDSEFGKMVTDHIAAVKTRYDNFGHGAAHGIFLSIVAVLPIMATNAMFERKSFKYILVNWGYWTLVIALMGGVLGKFF